MPPYYHDGTEINPVLIPVPGMCLICEKWDVDDPKEEILCKLNLMDQRNMDEFACYEYENIEKKSSKWD